MQYSKFKKNNGSFSPANSNQFNTFSPEPNPEPAPTQSFQKHNLIIYGLFAVLLFTNLITGFAFFMTPEIRAIFEESDNSTLSAYEQRILSLRMEVDRLHSRQFRQTGDLNLQLQELTQQHQLLAEQHAFVRILAEKANELGVKLDSQANLASATQLSNLTSLPAGPVNSASYVKQLHNSVSSMAQDTRLALNSIQISASKTTQTIMNGLREINMQPALPQAEQMGQGGPLLPALEAEDSQSLANQANHVMLSLKQLEVAKSALKGAPIFYPFSSHQRMSSGFGNRRDPFGGKSAFHAGMDFAARSGTPVLATGAGKVTFAGVKSGYGNVVEIDHGGVTTRYAHLSKIRVKVGQQVTRQQTIGNVGSTGRSTGPHLHLEYRVNDTPKNPASYINLASKLGKFLI